MPPHDDLLSQLDARIAGAGKPTLSTHGGWICDLFEEHPEVVDLASVEQKAEDIITILQKGRTGSAREACIEAIVTSLTGPDLKSLIRLVNQGGDEYDWGKLLFDDIDDPDILTRVVQHVASHTTWHEVGVISDFDDTVAPWKSTGDGEHPGIFAGMAALLHELDKDTDGQGEAGDVHYVTARPSMIGGALYDYVTDHGFPEGSVDFGSLASVGPDGRLAGKLADIERLLRLYPGQKFVLFGDTTQQDPEVYKTIKERHPDRILAAAVHRVGDLDAPANAPERLEGLIAFDHAVDVARALHAQGVLSEASLGRVLDAARDGGLSFEP